MTVNLQATTQINLDNYTLISAKISEYQLLLPDGSKKPLKSEVNLNRNFEEECAALVDSKDNYSDYHYKQSPQDVFNAPLWIDGIKRDPEHDGVLISQTVELCYAIKLNNN